MSLSQICRAWTNRDRHFDTMSRDTPSSAATPLIVPPSSQASITRARSASACEVFRRRDHAVSVKRSSSVRSRGTTFGLGTDQAYQVQANY